MMDRCGILWRSSGAKRLRSAEQPEHLEGVMNQIGRRNLEDCPLLTVAEAAVKLGISRSRAYELARTNELPGVTKLGRSFVVKTAVVNRWLEAA
jgi:excisionase family DNA binding protein